MIIGSMLALMLAPATAEVAVVDGSLSAGCAALPMAGVGSAAVGGGTLTVSGAERRRTLNLDKRRIALGGDIASATIRATCRTGATDYVLVAVTPVAASCPVQYQVVEVRGAGPLRISRRFGDCTDGATAALAGDGLTVTMPAGTAREGPATYRYAAGRVTLTTVKLPPMQPPIIAEEPRRNGRGRSIGLATWQAPAACAAIARAQPAVAADVYLSELRRTWPSDWQSRGRLADQPFSASSLRAVVTDLSCLAALPGGESVVIETSRPLFASRRHGKAAFEQLDEVARGTTVDPAIRAAARLFHAQMRYRVDEVRLR